MIIVDLYLHTFFTLSLSTKVVDSSGNLFMLIVESIKIVME